MIQTTARSPSRNPRQSWTTAAYSQLQNNFGALLLAGVAAALCLFVAFVGVLQNAVQRGELFRQQLSLGNSQPAAATYSAGYATRFHVGQQVMGAPVAPSLVLAAHGSR